MIINVRGTSGAGKSTLVRLIMERYTTREPIYVDGRKQAIGYGCLRTGAVPLWVVGDYSRPTGGADTFKHLDVYEQVRAKASTGCHVLYEGLLLSYEVRRCVELHRDFPLVVIGLNTSLEDCVAGIRARRAARGDASPVNRAYLTKRLKDMETTRRRLKDSGVDYRSHSRAAAEEAVVEILGLTVIAQVA
jgi:hypothetical protein